MDDKRQFNRWFREGEDTAVVASAGDKDVGHIIDMSVGGMRVALHKPMHVGEEVYSEFNVMEFPYYVKGKINRVLQQGAEWEIAIAFEKVSSIPLSV